MERPLPRRRAPLLARRCPHARRTRDPDRRLARRLRRRRRRRPRASTSSSRTTASRSPISSPTPTSTTRPTARTIATARTTISPGTTASRARPTTPRSSRRARATSAICWRRCLSPRGVPMLPMGAEIGHSQQGNNNAYAQDNAISWIDWAPADAKARRLRRPPRGRGAAHPALKRAAWLTGAPLGERRLADVEWRDAELPLDDGAHWDIAARRRAGRRVRRAARRTASIARCVAFNRGAATLAAPARTAGRLRLAGPARHQRRSPTRIDAPTEARRPHAAPRALDADPRGDADLRDGRRARRTRATIDALADAAGIAAEWWDVEGKRTLVSTATKLALLDCFGLAARTQAQAREIARPA